MAIIVHATYVCSRCDPADVILFHFAMDDGVYLEFAHGYGHVAFRGWQGAPPQAWLERLDADGSVSGPLRGG